MADAEGRDASWTPPQDADAPAVHTPPPDVWAPPAPTGEEAGFEPPREPAVPGLSLLQFFMTGVAVIVMLVSITGVSNRDNQRAPATLNGLPRAEDAVSRQWVDERIEELRGDSIKWRVAAYQRDAGDRLYMLQVGPTRLDADEEFDAIRDEVPGYTGPIEIGGVSCGAHAGRRYAACMWTEQFMSGWVFAYDTDINDAAAAADEARRAMRQSPMLETAAWSTAAAMSFPMSVQAVLVRRYRRAAVLAGLTLLTVGSVLGWWL